MRSTLEKDVFDDRKIPFWARIKFWPLRASEGELIYYLSRIILLSFRCHIIRKFRDEDSEILPLLNFSPFLAGNLFSSQTDQQCKYHFVRGIDSRYLYQIISAVPSCEYFDDRNTASPRDDKDQVRYTGQLWFPSAPEQSGTLDKPNRFLQIHVSVKSIERMIL
jgi:hypothetical protein